MKSYIGAHWGIRAESVDDAADRVAQLLLAFAALDPALTGWRDLGRSKRQALSQPSTTTDHAELVQRLLDGRNRTDIGNQVIEDLGYSLYWWNGGPDDHRPVAKLNIHIADRSTGNTVVFDLPEPEVAANLYARETARKLLHIAVRVFDPDGVVWSNSGLLDKQTEPDRPTEDGRGIILGRLVGQAAGWANYLSDSGSVKFDTGLVPTGAAIERVGTGTLVMLDGNPASPAINDVLQLRRAMGYQVPPPQPPPSAAVQPPPPPPAASVGPATSETPYIHPASGTQSVPAKSGDPEAGTQAPAAPSNSANTDTQDRTTGDQDMC